MSHPAPDPFDDLLDETGRYYRLLPDAVDPKAELWWRPIHIAHAASGRTWRNVS